MATGSSANTATPKSTEKSPCTTLIKGAPWYTPEQLAEPKPKWPAAVRDKKFRGQVEMVALPVLTMDDLIKHKEARRNASNQRRETNSGTTQERSVEPVQTSKRKTAGKTS